jgi:hypothetical protein
MNEAEAEAVARLKGNYTGDISALGNCMLTKTEILNSIVS